MSGRRLVLFCLLLMLAGCQQLRYRPDAGWVALGTGYYQLADSWPGKKQQLVQQVNWRQGEQQQQFLLTLLLQDEGYLLVALSPIGQELGRLQYQRGHKLSVSGVAPFNQPGFARRLLAEMQLALLSDAQLLGRLHGLTLQQQHHSRMVRQNDGRVLLQIAPLTAPAPGQQIKVSAEHYQLQIVTLQQDFL